MSRPLAVITLFRDPGETLMAARFNPHHAKARPLIERAKGIMKAR